MKRTSILAASLMCSVILSAQTREAAVLFSGTELDESYLLAENVSVTFNEAGKALISLDCTDKMEFVFDESHPVTAEFKDAFKLTANQDPINTSNYYSTFYTSEGAYKMPEDGSAKAYVGKVEKGEKTDVLKLTDVGTIIHAEEPVILRAGQSDITLMPSCNKVAASTGNVLEGTDEGKTLGANQYALSLGQNGVGFYLWNGKPIGANKAYLTLDASEARANLFTFEFKDEPTGIESLTPTLSEGEGAIYNLNGVRVDENYKGVVIKNGKKVYQK